MICLLYCKYLRRNIAHRRGHISTKFDFATMTKVVAGPRVDFFGHLKFLHAHNILMNSLVCQTSRVRGLGQSNLYKVGFAGTALTRPGGRMVTALSKDDDDDAKPGEIEIRLEETSTVDDWGNTWAVSPNDTPFKRDALFAALLIISGILLTIGFQMGLRKMRIFPKISQRRHVSERQYPALYSHEREYGSAGLHPRTQEEPEQARNDAFSDSRFAADSDNKLPLRVPEAESALEKSSQIQRTRLDQFNSRVDGGQKPDQEEADGQYYDWDVLFSDEEAPKGISLAEMKDRTEKASYAAAHAQYHAHQASYAAAISTEAAHRAQGAAHEAIRAAMTCEKALKRKSGEAIIEAYHVAKDAEAEAEKAKRKSSEQSAKAVMDEKSCTKAANKAIAYGDLSKPHGIINNLKAFWFDASDIVSRCFAWSKEVASMLAEKAKSMSRALHH